MKIVTPKQIVKQLQKWDAGCPHVPFPSRFLASCLVTMYLDLFISFLFSYQIFVILTVWGCIVFIFYYYLICKLFRFFELSRFKTHILLVLNTVLTAAAAIWLKGILVEIFF